ncbi:bifunctional sulfate adenylyltransferase subunit 1/adenylylsulfate kinase protein [Caballeronia calidae]|uniref:Adenylyl-sulfate kinase n=2 Tax=Caballeronia calidae TaxID=1777139 RepID=A0A158BDA0_9BURK|nr:bifunctional sulfate adenylyltransferase subunit 1/adenylylsulfate kinase protein [Caballeronia calidae]
MAYMNPAASPGNVMLSPRIRAGIVVWLTGMSGAGKSTIAMALRRAIEPSCDFVCMLDGDDLRRGVNSDLGFSDADRHENIRRIGEIAVLLARQRAVCIVSAISPFEADRRLVRQLTEPLPFVEIFIDTPLDVCMTRDPKGLYRRALRGEIRQLTGFDSPYEKPSCPELTIDTSRSCVDSCTARIVEFLNGLAGE